MWSVRQYTVVVLSVCCDLTFYKVCVAFVSNFRLYDSRFRNSVFATLFEVRAGCQVPIISENEFFSCLHGPINDSNEIPKTTLCWKTP